MSELETQIANRRQKRRRLAERGVDPYPLRCDYDLEPAEVHARYGERGFGRHRHGTRRGR